MRGSSFAKSQAGSPKRAATEWGSLVGGGGGRRVTGRALLALALHLAAAHEVEERALEVVRLDLQGLGDLADGLGRLVLQERDDVRPQAVDLGLDVGRRPAGAGARRGVSAGD